MKRIILGIALLAAPAVVSAQTCTVSPCAATPITTALKVKSAVSFSPGSNLDFGAATPGSAGAVDAQGVSATGGSAGSVILNANQAVAISATFSTLTSGALPALSVTSPSCGWSTTTTTSATNTTIFACTGGAYSSPATGTTATGVRVWLGGSVLTTASTPAANYAGTATVTGTYTAY